MSFFTTKRERRLWVLTAIIVVTLYATIPLARSLFELLGDQNRNAVLFVLSALLIVAAVVSQGIQKRRPSGIEIMVVLGVIAVYVLLFVRLTGSTERSHLMEYSIVALFILEALKERKSQGGKVKHPAFIAIGVTILIGIIDEVIQYFVPGRVMDPLDMVFNAFAALLAVGAGSLLSWARNRYGGDKGRQK